MSVKRIIGNIKIETGYVIPERKYGYRSGRSKYNFVLDMKTGESFTIPLHQRENFLNGIANVKKKHSNLKIVSRTIDGQVRIWRVA